MNSLVEDKSLDLELLDFSKIILPPCPSVGIELIKLRNDPDVTVEELANVIELDPSLTANLFRICNSSLYRNLIPKENIEDCIIHSLGVDGALDLALELCILAEMNADPSVMNESCWLHSMATGEIAKSLSKLPNFESEGVIAKDAYLCGLLHDIGHILLNSVFGKDYHLAFDMTFPDMVKEGTALGEFEISLYGSTHASVGYELAENWGLPDKICKAIRYHHTSPIPEVKDKIYVGLVVLAENILTHLNPNEGIDSLRDIPVELLNQVGLSNYRDLSGRVMRNIGRIVNNYRSVI